MKQESLVSAREIQNYAKSVAGIEYLFSALKIQASTEKEKELIREIFDQIVNGSRFFFVHALRNQALVEAVRSHQKNSPDKHIVVIAGHNHISEELLSNFSEEEYCAIQLPESEEDRDQKACADHAAKLWKDDNEVSKAIALVREENPKKVVPITGIEFLNKTVDYLGKLNQLFLNFEAEMENEKSPPAYLPRVEESKKYREKIAQKIQEIEGKLKALSP